MKDDPKEAKDALSWSRKVVTLCKRKINRKQG